MISNHKVVKKLKCHRIVQVKGPLKRSSPSIGSGKG